MLCSLKVISFADIQVSGYIGISYLYSAMMRGLGSEFICLNLQAQRSSFFMYRIPTSTFE